MAVPHSQERAYFELHLPVFKQGDDLEACINAVQAQDDKLPDTQVYARAFMKQAEHYSQAAHICVQLAAHLNRLKGQYLHVYADTHHIGFQGDVETLSRFVDADGNSLLDVLPWLGEE